MGIYLNSGNDAFADILNSEYIDKTGLISYINHTIRTPNKLTCFTRPRRFGKSFAALMLSAYYDKSCDSHRLFDSLEIARSSTYEKYLNQYDVIYLDITQFLSYSSDHSTLVKEIQDAVIEELREAFPGCIPETEHVLARAMIRIHQKTGAQFIVIIDEWDALFREEKENESIQKEYVMMLRGLFKSGPAAKSMIAAAYMTGILPIKKYGTQSALTDFQEYSMTSPAKLAQYIGFTQREVQQLCEKHFLDYEKMGRWYDGYTFHQISHIYSPNSVMRAIQNEEIRNYWTQSETYESVKQYIGMNFDGLRDAIISMLGGETIHLNTITFQNDLVTLHNRDDVLTLLVHLGYLAYDETAETVSIPNLEVAESIKSAVEYSGWGKVSEALQKSDQLLTDTIQGRSESVARALDTIHSDNTSIFQYHDENSLSCVITIAYYTAKKEYQLIRELPAGNGFADIVLLPYNATDKPALLIELKYDKSADAAIRQIKEKRYDGVLRNHTGKVILVGINYDKKTKHHDCVIESM